MNANTFFKHLTEETTDVYPESRRTKIVCTIGPKTQSPEMLGALIEAGMNVVRMNFSHGSYDFHEATVRNLQQVTREKNVVCALMLDTKGPEIRTGKLVDHKEVLLRKGQEFMIYTDTTVIGDETKCCLDYQNITKVLKVGDCVLIDDGLITTTVLEIGEGFLRTRVENAGMLGENKGCNLPNVVVDLPALTEKDKSDLAWGVEMGVDFIAASFVRRREDVEQIRVVLGERGAHIKIISKIENREGINNFDDILNTSDGIMVARGDLGVEIPIEKVCIAQKMMISKCNAVGKPVITATQMLENMIKNPRPTRAEATDVANAVFDGTDCVMLSGETAKGDYPVETVRIMGKICQTAEAVYDYRSMYLSLRSTSDAPLALTEAVASSAVKTANDLRANLVVIFTETGYTARLISKYRPFAPVFCITAHKETARQLMVSRGLFPIVVGSVRGADAIVSRTIAIAKERLMVKKGDFVIVTSGKQEGVAGLTNLLKVVTVE